MRTFSMVLAVITVFILVVFGYAALTVNIGVEVRTTIAEPASNQYEAFATACSWAKEDGNSSVRKFTADEPGDVSGYSMVYMTVELSNWCFLPAEWVQVNVQPAAGDFLQIRQEPATARQMGRTTLQAVLISASPAPTVPRQVEVEYYIFGRKYTVMSQLM